MKTFRSTSALAGQFSKPTTSTLLAAKRAPITPFLQHQQRRTFLPNPFGNNGIQTLTASKTLPYASSTLYSIIADIPSYNKFIPFCLSSTVTKTSNPDANGTPWPEEALLIIGFNNDLRESWYSRVYCSPQTLTLESVSGKTETSLDKSEIAHHNPRPAKDQDPARNATVLTHLSSKWTLKPFPYKPGPEKGENPREVSGKEPAREQTQVNLVIEYEFANPLYATISAAAAPKVADKMIEAFENRVKAVLDEKAATA